MEWNKKRLHKLVWKLFVWVMAVWLFSTILNRSNYFLVDCRYKNTNQTYLQRTSQIFQPCIYINVSLVCMFRVNKIWIPSKAYFGIFFFFIVFQGQKGDENDIHLKYASFICINEHSLTKITNEEQPNNNVVHFDSNCRNLFPPSFSATAHLSDIPKPPKRAWVLEISGLLHFTERVC